MTSNISGRRMSDKHVCLQFERFPDAAHWCSLRWPSTMKLHRDPTAEFADLATTRYQRYVLYRLESAAGSSPWRYCGIWALLVVPGLLRSARFGVLDNAWYIAIMTFIALLSIGEVYFSRAVLSMMRGSKFREEKINLQAPPNRPLPPAQFQ